jgi:class 3 adenylate cyclase
VRVERSVDPPPVTEPLRQPTVVLFVDIVDAAPLAVSPGDRAWAELLEGVRSLKGLSGTRRVFGVGPDGSARMPAA